MKLKRCFCIVAVLIAASGASADSPPPGTMSVASRRFLVVEQAEVGFYFEHLILLSELSWLREIFEEDPALRGLSTLSIEKWSKPPSELFSDEMVSSNYGDRNSVPSLFRSPGLVSEARAGELNPTVINFRPEEPSPEFSMDCAGANVELTTFDFCVILAAYDPDPATVIVGTIEDPPPFLQLAADLPQIVERMQEVVVCLDVTEREPADPVAALAELLYVNPTLRGCSNGNS